MVLPIHLKLFTETYITVSHNLKISKTNFTLVSTQENITRLQTKVHHSAIIQVLY